MASESDVIGWSVWVDVLLLVETEEACEARESTLGRLDFGSFTDDGGLPSGGSLLSEVLLELDGEGVRTEDRSWETA